MITDASVLGRESVFRLTVCGEERQQEYLQKAEKFLGIDFPRSYVQRATVLTLVDQLGEMLGGALVVTEPEYRSLLSIPPTAVDWTAQFTCDSDVAEINGVWLSPEVRTPILPVTFWRQFINHLLTLPKHRFLFTYDHSNKQMRKITGWLRYDVLYSGLTEQLPGMQHPSQETIAVLHRDSFARLIETLNRFEGSAVPDYGAALPVSRG
jgi:hypothetical protein